MDVCKGLLRRLLDVLSSKFSGVEELTTEITELRDLIDVSWHAYDLANGAALSRWGLILAGRNRCSESMYRATSRCRNVANGNRIKETCADLEGSRSHNEFLRVLHIFEHSVSLICSLPDSLAPSYGFCVQPSCGSVQCVTSNPHDDLGGWFWVACGVWSPSPPGSPPARSNNEAHRALTWARGAAGVKH